MIKCHHCNHDVELITYKDERTGKTLVSHGVCTFCLRNIVLPNEPIEEFLDENEKKQLKNYKKEQNNKDFISKTTAKVMVGDKIDTIENHLIECLRFKVDGITIPFSDEDGDAKLHHFLVNNRMYEPKYLTAYYKLLWCKYLDKHANEINLNNCNEKIVEQYLKEGRSSIMKDTSVTKLLLLMKQKHCVREEVTDIFEYKTEVIAHQTNCVGAMGKGFALFIKQYYPHVYQEYKKLCNKHYNGQGLLGKCQLVSENGKIIDLCSMIKKEDGMLIANLFGQNTYGGSQETIYEFLKVALLELKYLAQTHNLWVSVPYKIGCNLGGGDWSKVRTIIDEIFVDYPITICRLPDTK